MTRADGELVDGDERDVRLGVARGRDEGVARPVVAARRESAERFEAHHWRGVLQAAGEHAGPFPAGRGGTHRKPPCLRIGIGGGVHDQRFVERAGDDQRLERQAADARVAQTVCCPVRVVLLVDARERPKRGERRSARWPAIVLPADERFETFCHTQAVGHALGALRNGEERGLRTRDIV